MIHPPPSYCTRGVGINFGPTNRTEFEIFRVGVDSEELIVVDIIVSNDVDGFDDDDSKFVNFRFIVSDGDNENYRLV